MPKIITTQTWIEKSEEKYKGLYTYEKTKYVNQDTELVVTCKLHGDLLVNPKRFLGSKKLTCRYCKGFIPNIEMTQRDLQKWYSYEEHTGKFKVRATGRELGTKADGYLIVNMKGKMYSIHRLAFLYMTGKFPDTVDHKNRIRTDNRWINLVNGDYFGNNQNITSLGIVKNKSGTYSARRMKFGEYEYYGTFDNKQDAIDASDNRLIVEDIVCSV